jgi:hypothetical protein
VLELMDPTATWTAIGVGVAIAAPLLILLAKLVAQSGEHQANIGNLKESVAAIHRRLDEHEVDDKRTASGLHDKLDTFMDNIDAKFTKLINVLLGKNIIEAGDVTPNGRSRSRPPSE